MHKSYPIITFFFVLAELNLVNASSFRVVCWLPGAHDSALTHAYYRLMFYFLDMLEYLTCESLQDFHCPKTVFSDPSSVQLVELQSREVYIVSAQVYLFLRSTRHQVFSYVGPLILQCYDSHCKLIFGFLLKLCTISTAKPILSIQDFVDRGASVLVFLCRANEEMLEGILFCLMFLICFV